MASGMNGAQMAAEVIQAMGGRQTPARVRAFQKMCEAIVAHIQKNMVVTSQGADPQGGAVTSTSTQVQ